MSLSADVEVACKCCPKAAADVANLAGGTATFESSWWSGREAAESNRDLMGEPVYNFELSFENSIGTVEMTCCEKVDSGTAADFDADWSVSASEDGLTPAEEHMSAVAVDHTSLKNLGGDIALNSLLLWVSCDAIEWYGGKHLVLVAGEANAAVKTKEMGVATGGEGNGGATHLEPYHGCDVSAGMVSPPMRSVYKGTITM